MYAATAREPFSPPVAPPVDAAAFMRSVYRWMGLGLGLTGLVASLVVSNRELTRLIVGTPIFFLLLIAELIMVVVFSRSVTKVGYGTLATMFTVYSATSGLTFSVYFLVYTHASIALAFYVTGGMFAAMSAYGTLTKNDLSSWGSIALMALFGVIIAGVVNMFLGSTIIYMLLSVAAVFIFTALTAYDTQKIRALAATGDRRFALAGALSLYLDFVNLFIALLRLFGRRR